LGEGVIRTDDGEIVGWVAPAGRLPPSAEALLTPAILEGEDVMTIRGEVLMRPWELVLKNPDTIVADIAALHPDAARATAPAQVFHWGAHPLFIDPLARVEPGCALDTTNGPIWLDRDAQVRAFTRLAGPAYVGPGSIVLGGAVEAV